MDKWKVIVIIFLLGGLAGYGAYQQKLASQPPEMTTSDADATPGPTPTPSPLVGKPASAWNIPQGFWMNTPQPIALKDLKGHVTLIEFFRVECWHCEEAAPFMSELYRKYQPRGLKMVAFQSPGRESKRESNWAEVQATVRLWKIPYPVAFDKSANLFKSKYGGETYPTIIVLDKQGIIRFYQTGHIEEKALALENFINNALK